jgi:hypothetical protein
MEKEKSHQLAARLRPRKERLTREPRSLYNVENPTMSRAAAVMSVGAA